MAETKNGYGWCQSCGALVFNSSRCHKCGGKVKPFCVDLQLVQQAERIKELEMNKNIDPLEVVKDYIAVNKGEMSILFFARKWKIPYREFQRLAYVLDKPESERIKELEAELMEANKQLDNARDCLWGEKADYTKELEELRDTVQISCNPPDDCNDPVVLKNYMKACFDKAMAR